MRLDIEEVKSILFSGKKMEITGEERIRIEESYEFLKKFACENTYQVMAILMMALAQATDCLEIKERLAERTGEMYDEVRKITGRIVEDRPLYEDVRKVTEYLKRCGER